MAPGKITTNLKCGKVTVLFPMEQKLSRLDQTHYSIAIFEGSHEFDGYSCTSSAAPNLSNYLAVSCAAFLGGLVVVILLNQANHRRAASGTILHSVAGPWACLYERY